MKAPSLQLRLAWRLGLVFLGAIILACGVVVWRAVTVGDAALERTVQAQAEDVLRHLSIGPDGTRHLALPPSLAALYERRDGRYVYAVLDASGQVLLASSPEAAMVAAQIAVGVSGFLQAPSGAHDYFGYALGDQDVTVIAAEDSQIHRDLLLDAILSELFEVSLWWLLLLTLAAMGVGVATLHSGLRPLLAVSEAASRLGPTTVTQRLPEADVPREVLPVIRALNRALGRLEQGFELQRRFTADAAHELRTPLAILSTRLELLPDSPVVQALRQDVANIVRLSQQLLAAARLDAAPLDLSQQIDLRQIAVEAIATVAPLFVPKGRSISLTGSQAPVLLRGNAAVLTAAVTNLLENALIHTSGDVEVEVSAGGCLRVLDRGAGIPEEQRSRIFQRFYRAAASGTPGAGLGLAIVAAAVEAHGGSARVEPREGGGSAFVLELPLAGAASGARGSAA